MSDAHATAGPHPPTTSAPARRSGTDAGPTQASVLGESGWSTA
jgi:hypothetical protein